MDMINSIWIPEIPPEGKIRAVEILHEKKEASP